MNLLLPHLLGSAYKSPPQKARAITEAWALENLFCPACPEDHLSAMRGSTKAVDFQCPGCRQQFQFKAKSSSFGGRVVDGAYSTMLSALASNSAPSLCLMQYDLARWCARNLVLIPHFALPPSAILQRQPLSSSARRAGWVGCFIKLGNVPADAKIVIIQEGVPLPAESVRQQFARLKPLRELSLSERGWTLDVLNEVRKLGKAEFTNAEMYERAPALAALHPENRHLTDKIRQQLQFLRDRGFLIHVEQKRWRLTSSSAPAS
jgi:type II restriction enzyme